jgi:membrane-bound metal-dependent hydrolase YbcI (DUF457 family)
LLIFGHTGITLGAAVVAHKAFYLGRQVQAQGGSASVAEYNCAADCASSSSIARRLFHLDYRLILVGSLLPDIIDKPVGMFFFRDFFSNGRIFAHTLLFVLVIALIGLYLYQRQRQPWLLFLTFGSFLHLILDEMWLRPRTLFWPLYGLAFDKDDLTHWLQNILYDLRTDPALYIPELVGATILVGFAVLLVRRKRVVAFAKKGVI